MAGIFVASYARGALNAQNQSIPSVSRSSRKGPGNSPIENIHKRKSSKKKKPVEKWKTLPPLGRLQFLSGVSHFPTGSTTATGRYPLSITHITYKAQSFKGFTAKAHKFKEAVFEKRIR